MKVIYNNIIPFDGFKAMVIGPFIFARRGATILERNLHHEGIHWEQQKEMLIIGFYIAYLLLWAIEMIHCLFSRSRGTYRATHKLSVSKRAYYSIAFEREAYRHEEDNEYLRKRQHYAWLKKECWV